MPKRFVDKERIDRADRVARLVLEAERQNREVKTARLRAERLAFEGSNPKALPQTRKPRWQKSSIGKTVEVD